MNDDRPPQAAATASGEPASYTGRADDEASRQTGPAASEPPPLTAFAWRNRLVRPVQGRLLAGVCGALGRATNTDPILWRVLIAVLSILGGIGVLAYLLGWLLLPADGDTASPVEALAGRGHSGTSTVMAVIGAVVAMLSLGVFISEPFRPGPWGVILLGGAVLLLLRDKGRARPGASAAPSVAPMAPAATDPAATPGSPAAAFAPHGPYAATAPFSQPGAPYPPGQYGPPGPPPARPPGAPVPPVPRPPRSRLGRLTFFMTLLVLGGVGVVDLVGISVPTAGYIAAALATVGLSLIIGTWFGRARGMIALGIALSLALTAAAIVDRPDTRWWGGGGSVVWRPTSVDQLGEPFHHGAGDARLDLTDLDFAAATSPVEVFVDLDFGNLTIFVPADVDVTVLASIDVVGNADVLGETWNGFGLDARTITDTGPDGPGGGELRLTVSVEMGNLEVYR